MSADVMETLVGFHIALLIVLVARQPLARFGGAQWAYALWLLPLSRVVLPPVPLFSFTPASSTTYLLGVGEGAAPPPSLDGSGQWMPLLLAVWAGGAVLFLLWQAIAYWRLERTIVRTGRILPAFQGLEVVESAAVAAPLAMGFLHRRIVLPPDFRSRFSEAEQQLALMHEAVHHRRGDLWWNLGGLVLLAANWFSPLAHIAFRLFRTDQELACDAAVTAGAAPSARLDYAQALVKSASQPGLIAACPLNHADQLKRRLKMMTVHSNGRRAKFLGGTLAGALFMLGFAVSSANAAQEAKGSDEPSTIKKVIIKHGKDGKVELSGNFNEMLEKCRNENGSETTSETEGGAAKMRVVICDTDGNLTPEQRTKVASHLEEALNEVSSDEGKALIRKEITKLREGK